MKKKIDKNFAIIIGAIIISATIYTIYYNSSGATLTRECKKMANSFNWAKDSEVQGKAYIISRCLNGKPIN
tara:strand:+ start:1108 stop:1320 length:213 start_codon:yes stop_codon:yes gene_type:complete